MTGSDLTLRPASPLDAPQVSALIVHVLQISSLPDYGPENIARVVSHFTPETVAAMSHRNHMIVAEAQGRIVGTASLGGTDADIATYALRTFFVDPAAQGRGIGTRMLAVLEARARALGMRLLPVRSSIGGRPFYAARGFAVVDKVWEGDELTYQMVKPLP